MIKNLLTILLVIISAAAEAQFSRLLVQFTDKNNSPYSLSSPQQFLSPRSLARRTRYNISIDSTDLPIVPAYINAVKAQGGVEVLSQSKWLNQILIKTTDSAVIQQIRALPFVKGANSIAPRVQPEDIPAQIKLEAIQEAGQQTAAVVKTTADLYNYGNSYNQVHIHLGEFLHNKGYSGQGMMITILDAGFNNYRTNTAFDSIRLQGHVLGERDFVAFDNSVAEDDTHGKNCFSIIAANWPGRMVGTATKADFWLVRTEDAATEYPIEEHNWVVGAEFADSCGSDLITSSLGYTTFDNAVFNHTYDQFYTNSTMITMGAAFAAKKGMIVTISAGNDGNTAWHYLGFPADADSVCAVGAVTTAGNIAAFSSYGYPGKQKPNVVSVGQQTVIAGTTGPTTGNGTSYSNPNMAGLITCLWQAFPAFNNMKILSALYASGNRSASPDNRYGYGIPNMKTAYRSLKKDENQILYGNDWFWVNTNPFADTLAIRYIGQVDGSAHIDLLDASQNVIRSLNFVAEMQEVINYTFSDLGTLPAGNYTVRYTDSLTTRSIPAMKSGLLPLAFLSVNAHWVDNDAVIQWSATTATDAGRFNIQKSIDGASFTTIKSITPGSVPGTFTYHYTDAGAKHANNPDVFYRIELADNNNRKIRSSICRLPKQLSGSRMTLYPNPARESLQVWIVSAHDETAQLQIANTHGQVVHSQPVYLTGGSNSFTIPVSALAAGTYVITVKISTQVLSGRILVNGQW